MAFKPLTVNTPIGEEAHILAEDDAALYDGIFGEDCVLKLGEQFASKIISNNVIRVMDGVVVVGGHVGRIIKGDYEDMMIDNGTADQKRNDLIVARFQSGGTGGADTYSLVVVKGTPGSTAKDPAIVQEDLYAGGKQRDYPLYRVRIENLSVVGVDKLFKVNRNFKVLAEELDKTREKIDSVNKTLEERTNGKVRIYQNAEGGNIEITSKDGIKWEIDANANHLRIYSFGSSNKYVDYTFKYDRAGGVVATVEEVNKKMDKMTVVNNATTTASGTLLDGRMGKTLMDAINSLKKYETGNGKPNSGCINTNTEVTCRYLKKGHICQVSLVFTPLHTFGAEWDLFTGLPKATGMQDFQYTLYRESDSETVYGCMRIVGNSIKAWYGNQPKVGQTVRCGFTYICD